jgi:hypothetical protein
MPLVQTDADTIRHTSPTLDDLVVRVGWFSRREWTALARAAAGPLCKETCYAQWRKAARENLASIRRAGIRTRLVEVNASTFVLWCRERFKEVSSAALAEYIATCPDGE